jgi:signal transduction histidine kinase
MNPRLLSVIWKYITENRILIEGFLRSPMMDNHSKKLYYESDLDKRISSLKLIELITIVFFFLFFFYDLLKENDEALFIKESRLDMILISIIMLPFYIGLFFKQFKKHLHLWLFIHLFLIGTFVLASVYLFRTRVSMFHNFVGICVLIIAISTAFRLKSIYLSICVFYYITVFNVIIFYPDHGYRDSFFEKWDSLPIDLNIWFVSITLVSILLKIFIENHLKENFIHNMNLDNQQKELQEAINVKNRFINIITHDIKNLVSSQYTLSNMLSERHKGMPEEKRDEIIKLIDSSAFRTIEILDEVMIWAQTQQNRIKLQPKEYPLDLLIKKTIDLIMQTATYKEIKLVLQSKGPINLVVDENCFNTILRNIIGNAIKFSNKGGQIIICPRKTEKNVFVDITDNGVGMSDEIKDSLFKVDKMATTPGTFGEEGTGLGLILCLELARLNHGTLHVDSTLGKGTTITMEFSQIGYS